MKPPIKLRNVTAEELAQLDRLYRETRDVRIRERTQIVLLAAEAGLTAPEISRIVRRNDQTVRVWMKRFNEQGIAGMVDKPRSGAPAKVTQAYKERVVEIVRQRPRALNQPFSLWTLQRLADFMTAETAIQVSKVTMGRLLAAQEIVLSRPQHKVSSPDPEYLVKKRRLKSSEPT